MINIKLFHSLITITPGYCPDEPELERFQLCSNEPFSFQAAYRITDGSIHSQVMHVKIASDLDVSMYYVNPVPVMHTEIPHLQQVPPVNMYPDFLVPRAVNPELTPIQAGYNSEPDRVRYLELGRNTALKAYCDSWQTLWFTINEDSHDLTPGTSEIRVDLLSESLELMGSKTLTLEVLPVQLPDQKLIYTNWFHCDSLADFYQVELYSPAYWKIFDDFVRKASRNGMNMILTPAFTPALDTPVGRERMKTQLVDILADNGQYQFDFTRLKAFVRRCQNLGITHFEHAHLFSQWGANTAPNIYATVNGEEKRIFGWDNPSDSDEYRTFLRAYLVALRQFLADENLTDKFLIHLSDEPKPADAECFLRAKAGIADLLEGLTCGDALSNYELYANGAVSLPIVTTWHTADFLGRCDNMWCYYVGGGVMDGLSSRLILVPRQRNRILGVQLYYYKIKGFLHWGYNYYYGELSQGIFDPKTDTCGGFSTASTSYIVYPGNDGTALQSVRQKNFAEALLDVRALELLECLAGRQVCEDIIHKHFGKPDFFQSPETPELFLAFRAEVNEAIKVRL